MSATTPKIVLLTSGYVNGRRLARAMHHLRIPFELVTIAFEPPKRKSKPLMRHLADVAIARVKAIGVLRRVAQRNLPSFPRRARYAGPCNGPRLVRTLRALAPDYIVMMGGGILSPDVIGTARLGVLNSHPGLLPWIRGVHVIEAALLRDVAVGVTCHFIDAGIDTGDVIVRHLMPTTADDTLDALRDRANHLECAAMLSLVERIARGDTLMRLRQTERHPLCRLLPASEIARAEALARDGKAMALAAAWRDRIPDTDDDTTRAVLARYHEIMAAQA